MTNSDLPQEALALRDVVSKTKEDNINKPLFVVRVEDLTLKDKEYIFYPIYKLDECVNYINVIGYSTSKKQLENLTTYSQVLEYFETKGEKVQEKKIPWSRVLDIENKSYKRKK
jgi:hypothetical protein